MCRTVHGRHFCVLFLIGLICSAVYVRPAGAVSLYSALEKGKQLYAQEHYDKALETFLDAQIDHPENSRLKFNIASAQYKMNNYEEAVKGFLDVVETAQDAQIEEQALYNIGNAKYRQGKLQEAVEYYKKALEINPEDEDARKNLEFVREEIKKRMKEAEKTQQQCRQKEQESEQQQKTAQQQSQQDGSGRQQEKGDNKEKGSGQKQHSAKNDKADKDTGQKEAEARPETGGEGSDGQKAASASRKMTKEEAEQWLGALSENREKFSGKRMPRAQGARSGSEKPW